MPKKKKDEQPQTDILQVCADLSLRRPGFALLKYDAAIKSVTVQGMSHVDNKFAKKSHGEMLSEIAKELKGYLKEFGSAVLVREKGFFKFPAETQVLCKVIGVSDLYAWGYGNRIFDEIAPKAVKKLVTGDASASKEKVAQCLEAYVGAQEYACDDESDAVAVGVSW